MPELINDARTLAVATDRRASFGIVLGGRSGTPTVELPVIDRNLVEVTTIFQADPEGGAFAFEIKSLSNDATKLSGVEKVSVSGAGMRSCVRKDYFLVEIPNSAADDDATFEVEFSDVGAGGNAQAGNFVLIAKLVGSISI